MIWYDRTRYEMIRYKIGWDKLACDETRSDMIRSYRIGLKERIIWDELKPYTIHHMTSHHIQWH